MEWLKKRFGCGLYEVNLRTEAMAGLTMAASVLCAVIWVPMLLWQAGMDFSGAYLATLTTAVVGTLSAAFFGRMPVAVLPGFGLNIYLVFLVVLSQGYGWQDMLGTVFLASAVLSLCIWKGWYQRLAASFPEPLRMGMLGGTGLLIFVHGLKTGKLITGSPMTVTMLGDFSEPAVFLTVLGFFVSLALWVWRIRGALLFGMLASVIAALLEGFLVLPAAPFAIPAGLDQTALQLRFMHLDMLGTVVMTVFFVLFFDALGTVYGVRHLQADSPAVTRMMRNTLLCSALSGCLGALLGAGAVSCRPESAAGAADGGRSGVAACFAACFLLPLFFCAPLVKSLADMPSVLASVLLFTGLLLFREVHLTEKADITECFPMLTALVMIPLSYSIAAGFGCGVLLHVFLKLFAGQRKKVHPLLYVLSVLFFVQFLLAVF